MSALRLQTGALMLRKEITSAEKPGKRVKDICKRKGQRRRSPLRRELCSKGLMTALVSNLVRDADLRREPHYGYYPGGFYVIGSTRGRERLGRVEETMATWLEEANRHWGKSRGKSGGTLMTDHSFRHSSQPAKPPSLRPHTATQPIKALLSGVHIRPQAVRPLPSHLLPSPKTIGRKPDSVRSVIDVKIPSPKRGETPERGKKGHCKSMSMGETDI